MAKTIIVTEKNIKRLAKRPCIYCPDTWVIGDRVWASCSSPVKHAHVKCRAKHEIG